MAKLQNHFRSINDSFGQATCNDLKDLGQAQVGTDLHAALIACTKQDYRAVLVGDPAQPTEAVDAAAHMLLPVVSHALT